MSQERVKVVRTIYEAFARKDIAALLAATHPEIVCHDRPGHPLEMVSRGHAGLVAMIEDDMETVDEIRWEARKFTEVGQHVMVRVRQSGRGRRSGVPVEGEVVMVWTVDGGMATELRIYSTEAEALEAVGPSE